jgi:hypothetical protein
MIIIPLRRIRVKVAATLITICIPNWILYYIILNRKCWYVLQLLQLWSDQLLVEKNILIVRDNWRHILYNRRRRVSSDVLIARSSSRSIGLLFNFGVDLLVVVAQDVPRLECQIRFLSDWVRRQLVLLKALKSLVFHLKLLNWVLRCLGVSLLWSPASRAVPLVQLFVFSCVDALKSYAVKAESLSPLCRKSI